MGAIACIAVALWLTGTFAWPSLVRHLAFQPRTLSAAEKEPRRWGLPRAESVAFSAPGGPMLHGWWAPSDSTSCGTVILFHGNAGNIATRAWQARWLNEARFDVLLFDYRGYGGSEGTPTEAGLKADALAAHDHVVRKHHAEVDRLILVGHSMGTVMATHVASRRTAAALVLEAPFLSAADVTRRLTGWMPWGWPGLGGLEMDAGREIGAVQMPILMAIGGKDELVSRASSERLYASAPEPKEWLVVPEAGHNEIFSSPAFWRTLLAFSARALEATRKADGEDVPCA